MILIHGLWMTGLEMQWLGLRLRRCGFSPRLYPYADVRCSPAENAKRLQDWLDSVPGDQVHFVGHSLGGILLLHLFHRFPEQRPGRVVFLGTPAEGSIAARRATRIPWLRILFGKSLEQGLHGGAPQWCGGRDLGIVAGTRGMGIGHLFGGLSQPHDGAVALEETRLPGATERVSVAASHMGLLVSAPAARQVCAFLRNGRFEW